MACRATQRPIRLRRKCGTGKSMRKGGLRPLGWPIGRQPIQGVLRCLGRSSCFRRGRRRSGINGIGFSKGRSSAWRNGRRRSIRRRVIIGRRCRRLLHLRIGQVRHAHRGRLGLLPKLQAQVPHPLIDDLPELLAPLRSRYQAIDRLFLIFISEHCLERTPMQIQIEHICRSKRVVWQGREELFMRAVPSRTLPIGVREDPAGCVARSMRMTSPVGAS
jgi:hypothetical protein